MKKIFKKEESVEIFKIHNIEMYENIYNHAWRKYKSRV